MNIKDKIHLISDLAFNAVDADGSQSLDKEELFDIMKEVAHEMQVTPPSTTDITCVLRELD